MIDRAIERINAINTTNVRTLASVCLAVFGVIAVLIGILWRNWLPTEQQITVLKGLGLFLGVMMGIDLAQFTSKRFSDSGYAAAKNPSPVNVGGPSTVSVTATPVAAPASDGVGAPAAPAQPAAPVPDLAHLPAPEKGP